MIEATYIDHMGSDLSVVNAARVSFGKKSEAFSEGDSKLIKYLAKHKHMSPFGHAFISVHVKAPIFVARQLVKHKFLRWNEISRRYVADTPEIFTDTELRTAAEEIKQGSAGLHPKRGGLSSAIDKTNRKALSLYRSMIKQGVCPEQARMVLPQSTMTEWYWSGSLDAFADMCKLRLKEDTQYETRLVAQQVDEIIKPLFPVSWKELTK